MTLMRINRKMKVGESNVTSTAANLAIGRAVGRLNRKRDGTMAERRSIKKEVIKAVESIFAGPNSDQMDIPVQKICYAGMPSGSSPLLGCLTPIWAGPKTYHLFSQLGRPVQESSFTRLPRGSSPKLGSTTTGGPPGFCVSTQAEMVVGQPKTQLESALGV